MTCMRCEAENSPERTRCWRCHYQLSPSPDSERARPAYLHAATVPDPAVTEASRPAPALTVKPGGGARRGRPAVQPPLFPPGSKLVEFGDYCPCPQPPRPRAVRPRRLRASGPEPPPGQFLLDFEAGAAGLLSPAGAAERYRVASLGRRSIACVVDLAVALALGAVPFLAAVRMMLAQSWPGVPAMHLAMAASLWFIVGLYHLLFAAAGRPTPGQQFARLRLVTLQGRPGEPAHRVWRVLFNLCPPACLLGAAWAALTEETFSWADQVSGTYFTAADAGR